MMARITAWLATASAPLLAKIAIALLAVALTAAGGVSVWLKVLYARVDSLQGQLDEVHALSGRQDAAITGLELDNARLVSALERQTAAVERLAAEANAAREIADARAAEIAEITAPPADDGAAAMLVWWNDYVVL